MKKLLLGVMVMVLAVMSTSSALADNEKGERGERNGEFRNELQKKLTKYFRKGEKGRKSDNICPSTARDTYNSALKTAFSKFRDTKKSAHDVRVSELAAANGNQAAIDTAWKKYQVAWGAAWTAYSNAVFAAMMKYGADRSACNPVPPVASPTATPTPSSTPTPTPTPVGYNISQVAAHGTASDCWTAINGKVYNLSGFLNHPGGQSAIASLCGHDGSAAFNAQHGSAGTPNSMLSGFQIGVLVQ